MSGEPAALKISDFERDANNTKDALTKQIDRVAALARLALPSECYDVMQNRFLRTGYAEPNGAFTQSGQISRA